jgi:N-acetyl-anhydromuramyl-L-alanine amidase AmpD
MSNSPAKVMEQKVVVSRWALKHALDFLSENKAPDHLINELAEIIEASPVLVPSQFKNIEDYQTAQVKDVLRLVKDILEGIPNVPPREAVYG